ncbi:unnamed protein product [Phaedon cochleariae]|uniref:Uncharacterized protein n=1 Tax=Phaedon cochleariae TaxID=80249 RepID=A0A9P0GVT3_PHACE|nr:unnamed protein product [Phaedon cochleariae]
MEFHNTLVILALCLLFAEASMRDPRQDHQKNRRAQKSSSTTTAKPEPKKRQPDGQFKNEIKYDPIEVQYQVQQYPNLVGEAHHQQPSNVPQITQTLQQQQVNLQQVHVQQPMLQLPAATSQLHPFHQQQIIQMIQRALYATQRNNQPTAMIIIAQPAPRTAQPVFDSPYVGHAQPLAGFYRQQDDQQQGKYQLVQESAPQQLPQYIAESNLPNHIPQNYQFLPAASPFNYQPTPMPTTHMSPVQPETYPHHLSQISQLATQQYASPAHKYADPAYRFSGPANQFAGQSQQFSGPAHQFAGQSQQFSGSVPDYLSSAHQFQFDAESRGAGGSGQVGVPVRSLPPIITGFENFSPEQQEKIKEQLSAHFGAPLKLLHGKESAGQYQGLNDGGFVPSQQVKEGRSGRSSSIMSLTPNKSQKM